MQVIEMGVRNQHQVDGGKVCDAQSGTAQAFQNEQPPREVGVDNDVASADLYEETGMPDERDAEFAIGDQAWLVGLATAGSNRGVPHQTSELAGALAKRRIAKRLLDHPAIEPG